VTKPIEFSIHPTHADAFFVVAEQMISARYQDRPGVSMRKDLFWPKDGWVQHQLNLYVGPRAGLEVSYRQAPGASVGNVSVRTCGALEHKAQVYIALFGLAVAVCAFLFLLFDGFIWDRFTVPYTFRSFGGSHFSFGAMVFNALVPALMLGLLAGALAWPLSWLARPLCRKANQTERLDSPEELARRLQDVRP